MAVGGQSQVPAASPPEKKPGTHCTGGWVAPSVGLDVCRKSRPHRDFFSILLYSVSTSSVLVAVVLTVLRFAFTYNTQHKEPCRRRDSNPQSQQASGHRPTLQTARPLGSTANLNSAEHWYRALRYSAISEYRDSIPGPSGP